MAPALSRGAGVEVRVGVVSHSLLLFAGMDHSGPGVVWSREFPVGMSPAEGGVGGDREVGS